MATIGQQLLQPESGWKRYDDRNENINYVGSWVKGSYSSTQYYLGTDTYVDIGITSNKNSHTISFNFTGSKIRIIGFKNTSGTESCFVNIDGIEYNFSQNSSTLTQGCLNFELLNLTNKEHYVQIYSNNSNSSKYGMVFDAVDIDQNEELKQYNPNLYKYLIKQNNQYYTIKSDFYKNGNYEFITELEGKEILTQADFETYGIDDLNLLTKTIDTQVVKGINKGNLGVGKYFEMSFGNDFININEVI